MFDHDVVYFCSTQGGGAAEPTDSDTVQGWGNGWGQIWAYSTRTSRLSLVYQSPGPDTLDFPDNVTDAGAGAGAVRGQRQRQLPARPQPWRPAVGRRPQPARQPTGTTRFNDEFAGATFSPGGETLYVNIQAWQGHDVRHLGPLGAPRDLNNPNCP